MSPAVNIGNGMNSMKRLINEFLHLNLVCAYGACSRLKSQNLTMHIHALLEIQHENPTGRLRVVIPFTNWFEAQIDHPNEAMTAFQAFFRHLHGHKNINKLHILLDFGVNGVLEVLKIRPKVLSESDHKWLALRCQKAEEMVTFFRMRTMQNVATYIIQGVEESIQPDLFQWALSHVQVVYPGDTDAEMAQRQQFLFGQMERPHEFYWPYASLSEMIQATMTTHQQTPLL